MDITFIADAISAIGFPVLVCVCLFWMVLKLQKQHRQSEAELTAEIHNLGGKIDAVCAKIDTVERVNTATIQMAQDKLNAVNNTNGGKNSNGTVQIA